uniref:Uncharacterized protein n=1 Tax=Rousettus aegyptiacus TaxID=9407 RepID=A0A7J8C272_ROUAE|nr:hypothetical protein HJG63_009284 [Rousettus aegyptiacus]
MNTRNENRGDYTINSSRKTPNTSPELSGRRLFLFQGSGRSPSCFFGRCRPGPCLMALSIVYTRSPRFLGPRTAPVCSLCAGFRKHKHDDVLALARAARGDTLRSHHDTAP